jgi:altronate dehydratase large subunit
MALSAIERGFFGFRRPDGRFGVRNHVLILSIVGLASPAARRIAQSLRGVVLAATPYGRGQYGPDQISHQTQMIGLGHNPNVASVLVVGADRKTVDIVANAIAASGKTVEGVALDEFHEDSLALANAGIRKAAHLVRDASRLAPEHAPISGLFVGVECGHSDATSGLVANPLVGRAVDRLIDSGATAVFGETIEWLGAEHLLARRAGDAGVGDDIAAAVARRERAVAATGVDLTGNNPGAQNIKGGLSTIEEKSLGAIAKGGSRTIKGVLAVAERPAAPGLYVQDGPCFSPESLTGFASSGAQLMLFTTGPGNSFCNSLAPTIKVTGRDDTARRLTEQIDFDGSGVFLGREDIETAADRLVLHILAVASGEATWGEILGESDEAFVRVGASL